MWCNRTRNGSYSNVNNWTKAKKLVEYIGVVFRLLVRLGSFPACWRQANVTHIPKGPPSSSVANYRPISITSVLSKSCQTIYGTQWCASNHPVCLSERFEYLWCTFVCVPYTAKYIGEWEGGIVLYRLISAQPFIWSTIREFCISFVLWVLEVLCCLYLTVSIKSIIKCYGWLLSE